MSQRAALNPRLLDQWLTVERRRDPPSRSSTGAVTEEWRKVCSFWAKVDGKPAGPAEPENDGQRLTMRGFEVSLYAEIVDRYSITPADRVRWGSQLLDIKDMPQQGRRGRFITMHCVAGGNRG